MTVWGWFGVVLLVATGVVPVAVSQVIQHHVVVQIILLIHLFAAVITAVVQGAALNVFATGGIAAWILRQRRRRPLFQPRQREHQRQHRDLLALRLEAVVSRR